MESLAIDVLEIARSDVALRSYAVLAGTAILALSFYRAWKDYRALREIDPHDMLTPETRGRLPSTIRGWAKRARKDAEHVKYKFRTLVYGASRIALLGVGVPTVLLVFLTAYYTWFEPGAIAVIDERGMPVTEPGFADASIFVGGALAKGLFFDLIEVFQIPVSRFTNFSDNWVFSAAVLVYRAVANLFLVFVPFYLFSAWRAMKVVESDIQARADEGKSEVAQKAAHAA